MSPHKLAAFATIMIGIANGVTGEFCPAKPSTLCSGQNPYCCGVATDPSTLYCCSSCMKRFHEPCVLTTDWLVLIVAFGLLFLLVVCLAIAYCCRLYRTRRGVRYVYVHGSFGSDYAAISAPPQSTVGVLVRSEANTAWNNPAVPTRIPNQSSAYVPQAYSYVQERPGLYSYNYGSVDASQLPVSSPKHDSHMPV